MTADELSKVFEIGKLTTALLTAAAFAPGFVILYVRNFFVVGAATGVVPVTFEYLLLSSAYYALAAPWVLAHPPGYAGLVLLFLGVPALLGLALGVLMQRGAVTRALRGAGLDPLHPAPTAWDYAFGYRRMSGWVVVTLKDRKVYGYFGGTSYAGRNAEKRDIFLQRLTDAQFDDFDGSARSVWIDGAEILAVEFVEAKR